MYQQNKLAQICDIKMKLFLRIIKESATHTSLLLDGPPASQLDSFQFLHIIAFLQNKTQTQRKSVFLVSPWLTIITSILRCYYHTCGSIVFGFLLNIPINRTFFSCKVQNMNLNFGRSMIPLRPPSSYWNNSGNIPWFPTLFIRLYLVLLHCSFYAQIIILNNKQKIKKI